MMCTVAVIALYAPGESNGCLLQRFQTMEDLQ